MSIILILIAALVLFFYAGVIIWPTYSLWWMLEQQNRQRYRIHYEGEDYRFDAPGLIVAEVPDLKMALLLKRLTGLPVHWVHTEAVKLSPLTQYLLKHAKIKPLQPRELVHEQIPALILISARDYIALPNLPQPSWLANLIGVVAPDGERRRRPKRDLQLTLCRYSEAERDLNTALQYLAVHAWERYVDKLPLLIELWLEQARSGGKRLSVADSTGLKLSHQRLLNAVILLQQRLFQTLADNQRVGLCLPPSVGGVCGLLALLALGKTLVNLNYTASLDALKSAISESGITKVITSRHFTLQLQKRGFPIKELLRLVTPIYLEDIKAAMTPWVLLKSFFLAKCLPLSVLKALLIPPVAPHQTAFILFSSGSEGKPKGIELSHCNITGNVRQAATVLEARSDDVVLSVLPVFHAFGLTGTTLLPLIEGVSLVCHPDPTDTTAIGQLAEQYRPTVLCGTSTFLRFYAKARDITPAMFSSLRLVVAGAERLSPEVRVLFEAKFKKTVYEGYGTTELSPVASVNRPNTPFEIRQKIGSVGKPLPGCMVRIVDPDTGADLGADVAGLVLAGGVNVMQAYLNAPLKTKEVVVYEQGIRWYKTGDKGYLDAHGFLTILDRYSRFAKLGGEAVSLGAVEEQISLMLAEPALEILAVAVPDLKKGERIVLLHTEALSTAVIQEKVNRSLLHNLMKPSHYISVVAIPKLASGKTDYATAKALVYEELKLY